MSHPAFDGDFRTTPGSVESRFLAQRAWPNASRALPPAESPRRTVVITSSASVLSVMAPQDVDVVNGVVDSRAVRSATAGAPSTTPVE
jgi:hypothetical protein